MARGSAAVDFSDSGRTLLGLQTLATPYNDRVRRAWVSGVLAGAALIPPVVWLLPALLAHRAPTFRDQADFFFPLKLYTADRLRAGEIPLWNPLSGLGEPWLANAQSGVFYPPTLFFLILAPGARRGRSSSSSISRSPPGARGGSARTRASPTRGRFWRRAVFAGSGVAASLSPYWNHFGAFAYLPAIAALARSGLRARRGPRRGSRS